MDRNDFQDDLVIDPNELDVQAAKQGELFFKWAEKAALAKAKVDETKLRLEVCAAEVSSKVRTDPGKYGLSKVTEAGVETAVKESSEYREAYEDWIKARANSGLLDKAVEAMEQKKRMIEVLITLHGQSYFAGPAVPRNIAEAWLKEKEGRGKRVVDKTKKRLRKKESQ